MLILGLLLATVGVILYSLVQIMQASPVAGKGAGKTEQETSH